MVRATLCSLRRQLPASPSLPPHPPAPPARLTSACTAPPLSGPRVRLADRWLQLAPARTGCWAAAALLQSGRRSSLGPPLAGMSRPARLQPAAGRQQPAWKLTCMASLLGGTACTAGDQPADQLDSCGSSAPAAAPHLCLGPNNRLACPVPQATSNTSSRCGSAANS